MRRQAFTPRHIASLVSLLLGYLLSPLSWWNEPLVNLPLAYLFSYPFTRINEEWLIPSFVLGYWLSNILGLYLLRLGISGMTTRRRRRSLVWTDVFITLAYTLVMVIFIKLGWMPSPVELLSLLRNPHI